MKNTEPKSKKTNAKKIMEKANTSPKRIAKALKELPKKKVQFL